MAMFFLAPPGVVLLQLPATEGEQALSLAWLASLTLVRGRQGRSTAQDFIKLQVLSDVFILGSPAPFRGLAKACFSEGGEKSLLKNRLLKGAYLNCPPKWLITGENTCLGFLLESVPFQLSSCSSPILITDDPVAFLLEMLLCNQCKQFKIIWCNPCKV